VQALRKREVVGSTPAASTTPLKHYGNAASL
jgi:hypothetical protein